jgi:hypothetical protein
MTERELDGGGSAGGEAAHEDPFELKVVQESGVGVGLVDDRGALGHGGAEVAEPCRSDGPVLSPEPRIDQVADIVVAAEHAVAQEDGYAVALVDVVDCAPAGVDRGGRHGRDSPAGFSHLGPVRVSHGGSSSKAAGLEQTTEGGGEASRGEPSTTLRSKLNVRAPAIVLV